MKNFMSLVEELETVLTENGAVMNKTSGNQLIDLNFSIPNLRKLALRKNYDGLYKKFMHAYLEDKEYALRWLLYLRDVSEGIGERASFRGLLIAISKNNKELLHKLLTLDLPSFGRYDDIISIYRDVDEESKDIIINKIKTQLDKDIQNINTKNISLLAKWMPSAKTSNKKQKRLAEILARKMNIPIRNYRKILSSLRKAINVIEVKMCNNEWDSINYEHVPSKANLKYANAFMKHDSERRSQYIEDVKNNKKKINASVVFPSDIVHQYSHGEMWNSSVKAYNQDIENMWNNQKVFENFQDTLIVRDGSGSMTIAAPGTNITCLEVADALTLYCCQNNKGMYKDKFITFSSRPSVVDISDCNSLHDKLVRLRQEDDCSNTNIQATFDLLLETAVMNNLSQEELPKNVLIISDMEFDACTYHHNQNKLFTEIGKEWEDAGYILPRLIFWNVNSRTGGIPINRHSSGTILMSGYSQNLLKMAMSSEIDPWKALKEVLDNKRYDCVKKIL